MKYIIKKIFLVLVLFFTVFNLWAQPESRGFVTDYEGVINSSDKQFIEAVASEVKEKSGAEIAVLTVKTIEPFADIEEFAVETATKWGLGAKDKDNGVLIILSTGERKLRIEVGYGLEGAIPDGTAGSIMDNYMIPYLRDNDYSTGLKAGFIAVAAIVAKEYNFVIEGSSFNESAEAAAAKRNSSGSSGIGLIQILFLLVFFMSGGRIFWPLLFLSAASGRRSGPSGRGGFGSGFSRGSGGGFSGGFSGGFGGGSFGGGGASRGF